MTKEHRVVFALHDLTAIHLWCATCAARVVLSPAHHLAHRISMPEHCPVCDARWVQSVGDWNVACLEAIRTSLQNASRDAMPVALLFELDEDGARGGG